MNKKPKKPYNICICLAHNYPAFPQYFTLQLFKIQHAFYLWQKRTRRKDTLSLLVSGGFNLDDMRNNVTNDALKTKHTHLLFLDTDMVFQEDLIERMITVLEANPKHGVVTGIYTWKRPPYLPQIFSSFDEKDKVFRIIGSFPFDKVFEVAACGAGCMMVKAKVFKKMGHPYFKFVKKGEDKKLPHGLGEDLYFAWKSKIKMLADPTLLCGHYDSRPVGIEQYIKYNGLKIENHAILITEEQIEEIAYEHKNKKKKDS